MTSFAEPQKEFLLTLAYLYLQNAKWDRALVVLRALEILAPDDVRVSRCLACAYLHTGDLQAAWRAAEAGFRAPETREQDEAGRLLKAQILWQLGQSEQARNALAPGAPLQLPVPPAS